MSAMEADATAVYPDFVFDVANSSIQLDWNGGGCIFGSCSLNASFADGAVGYVFSPTAVGEMDHVADFIDWEIELEGKKVCFLGCITLPPSGAGSYNVTVNLAFSGPSAASSTTEGYSAFFTLAGALNGGVLIWDDQGFGTVEFAEGSVLGYELLGTVAVGLGTSTTTGIKFTALELTPIPLPAAGWMLIAGLGGIAAMKRRKRAA